MSEDSAWLERLSAAARRLSESRFVLGASAVALLAVDLASSGNGRLAAAAFAVVLAAAALVPRTSERRRNTVADEADPTIEALPAVQLAAAVQDPLYIFDRNGEILFGNEAAEAAFGATAPGLSLQLKFRAPEMHEFVRRVLEDGKAAVTDYAERVPIERAYRVAATPIGSSPGLFILLFKDQSEARRIDRMRADFIANASHELRTPLASIAGFIETLRGPAREDPQASDNFLQIMQNQTARMARLIDDLLSLSRLEMKPYVKPTGRVEIGRVVESVVESMAHVASDAGVAIECDLPDRSVAVAGNRDELVQVFENLIENACKYGASGGRVLVSVESESGEVRVTVRDFGPGIAEEHIPRITERFYRVDVETSRAQKGTGLGLSIVKHILTRHDARLSIRSKLDEGSSFTVHFPAVQAF